MLFKQSGWKVSKVKAIGFMSLIFNSSCLLLYSTGLLLSIRDQDDFSMIVWPTFMYLLIISGLTLISIYNFWKYPDILVNNYGILLKVFFYKKQFDWREINQIAKKNNELHIYVARKGLLLNRLYGLLDVKVWDKAVVLFVSDQEIVENLEEKLKAHIFRQQMEQKEFHD